MGSSAQLCLHSIISRAWRSLACQQAAMFQQPGVLYRNLFGSIMTNSLLVIKNEGQGKTLNSTSPKVSKNGFLFLSRTVCLTTLKRLDCNHICFSLWARAKIKSCKKTCSAKAFTNKQVTLEAHNAWKNKTCQSEVWPWRPDSCHSKLLKNRLLMFCITCLIKYVHPSGTSSTLRC